MLCSRLADEAFELCRGQRSAEMIALILIAAGGLQELELRGRLDALGHHLEPQAVRERDNRANN